MPTICGALFNYGRINLTKSISQKDRFYNILIKTTITQNFRIYCQLADIFKNIFAKFVRYSHVELALKSFVDLKYSGHLKVPYNVMVYIYIDYIIWAISFDIWPISVFVCMVRIGIEMSYNA